MWFTPKRAEGVRELALAIIMIIALLLAAAFGYSGWKALIAPDMALLNICIVVILANLVARALRKLR